MRENALELHGVCKKYGGFALRNVGFTLPRGTVMGLIGENGAGKTTTIKAVLDLIRPDSGEITVLGEHGSNPSVREKIGVVLENGGFPSTMNAVQVSTLLGRAYKNWNAEQFASYIEKFGIDREKAIRDYSKGMKTKLNIAAALSHDAELLLLDEPTSALTRSCGMRCSICCTTSCRTKITRSCCPATSRAIWTKSRTRSPLSTRARCC